MSLKDKRILYISYNGMLEPLGQSQVIPYLRELSKHNARFTLLSFERGNAFTTDGTKRVQALKRELSEDGIEWRCLRYHESPSLPATAFDVVQGIRTAARIVRRTGIELVHARSHIPAMIALRMKKRFGVKMIFDVRGLMADEYVDAEHWRKNSIPYRMTKSLERKALAAADGVVTLTERIWPIINEWEGLRERNPIHEVVPCCADLGLFTFNESERRARRIGLGVSEDRRILVYSGSIGGWYLADKMAELFAQIAKKDPSWHFLWLTTGPAQLIHDAMRRLGLSDAYSVQCADPAEVPSYLSAADAGIAFYKPMLSRLATSPVKVAEYLACGLPIIINRGVGDSDALVKTEELGAVIESFDEREYILAANAIERLIANRDQIRQRARRVAERMFDVRAVGAQRYARLYERVFAGSN
jgi:glycosyltransferase involved in cell wall biosynthesis